MLHFFLTAIAGMIFLLMFRIPIFIAALLIWKIRYILLVLVGSLVAYLTWDYQYRAAIERQRQQSWVEFLHSPDYVRPKLSFSDDKGWE
jgi:uncharacterized SAM-binding protein YcdF (DUF218 family)